MDLWGCGSGCGGSVGGSSEGKDAGRAGGEDERGGVWGNGARDGGGNTGVCGLEAWCEWGQVCG